MQTGTKVQTWPRTAVSERAGFRVGVDYHSAVPGNEPLPNPFADTLRVAIRESGLSLEGIVRRLGAKGSTISAGALSHWQSGRTSPARRDSLRAVGHLEEVLGIAPGTLRDLVKPAAVRGRPIRESRMAPVGRPAGHADRVRDLIAKVDMSSDDKLMRISQHDRLRVGADRAQESLVVRQILRAIQDGPDRFVIVFWIDDESWPLPELRALRGCTLGTVVTDETANAMVAELMFGRALSRGESVVTEHELTAVTPPPCGPDSYGRKLRHPIRECLIEVDFPPDAPPSWCEEVFIPEGASEDEAVRRKLVADEAGRVHAIALGVGPGDFEIRWGWD